MLWPSKFRWRNEHEKNQTGLGGHVAAIKSQGVSTTNYAQQHALARSTLYYWQNKLQRTSTESSKPDTARTPAQSSKFIALRLSEPLHPVSPTPTICTLVYREPIDFRKDRDGWQHIAVVSGDQVLPDGDGRMRVNPAQGFACCAPAQQVTQVGCRSPTAGRGVSLRHRLRSFRAAWTGLAAKFCRKNWHKLSLWSSRCLRCPAVSSTAEAHSG